MRSYVQLFKLIDVPNQGLTSREQDSTLWEKGFLVRVFCLVGFCNAEGQGYLAFISLLAIWRSIRFSWSREGIIPPLRVDEDRELAVHFEGKGRSGFALSKIQVNSQVWESFHWTSALCLDCQWCWRQHIPPVHFISLSKVQQDFFIVERRNGSYWGEGEERPGEAIGSQGHL